MSKAELQFYEAFIRLKNNKPNILPKGTKVSQNNVAKEAGVDPSALISTLNNRIDVLTQERDDAVSKLLEAQLTILELSQRLEKL